MNDRHGTETDGGQHGQRRHVTVLFVDVVSFTPLAERLGEEASFRLMQRVSVELMTAVHRHGGTVQEFTGDGIMALFGAPTAMEDAPLRACRAALEIQDRIRGLEDELDAAYGARPSVRVGLHTGPLVVGEVGIDQGAHVTAIGDTANMAARLQAEAEPGAVYISDELRSLVDGQVEASYVGERALKGKSAPLAVHRLIGLKPGLSRFGAALGRGLTSLVEREPELAALRRCWEGARSGGIRFALIVGEAGIGKSRLMHEFRRMLAGERMFVLEADCRADGATTAFLPFIHLVRTSFHISADDDRPTIERKLATGMGVLGLNAADGLPYLMALLGLGTDDPGFAGQGADTIGMRTRAILRDLIWQRCRIAPVALFVEDLHWIDSASEALLQSIAGAGLDVPLMVVCAFRPHYRPPWPRGETVTEVALRPLTRDGTMRLLSDRLGTTDLAGELVRLVLEKADGNPLFAEEIANYLREKRPVGDTVLPANLQNLLMERFDGLDQRTRSVLQTAAVIGRKFSSAIVERVAALDGGIGAPLDELERQELVFRVDDSNADYAFKHVLVQDAIYNTLMTSQQRVLHAEVGAALEQAYAGRLDEVADSLAHHFDLADRREETIRYLIMAGRKNLQMFSLDEADRLLARAFELSESSPEAVNEASFSEVLASWLEVTSWIANFRRMIDIIEPRRMLVEQIEQGGRYAQIIAFLGQAYAQANRFAEARETLERALSIAEDCSDEDAIAQACVGLMNLYNMRPGDVGHDYVVRLSERVIEISEKRDNLYLWTLGTLYLGWNMSIRGHFDEVRNIGLRLLERGRRSNYAGAVGYGYLGLAYADVFSDRYDEAIQHAHDGAVAAAGPGDRLCCQATEASAMVMAGRVEDGLARLERVRAEIVDRAYLSLTTLTDVPIGLAMVLDGRIDAGMAWLEDTVRRMRDWGNLHAAASGHFVLGEIYREMAAGNDKGAAGKILRNPRFFLKTMFRFKANALYNFDQAMQLGQHARMDGIAARALMQSGLVHKAARRPLEARRCLDEAQALAATLSWQFLRDRIGSELQTIN